MRELRSAKSYAIFLVSVVLVAIFSIPPTISSLMNTIVIGSTGQIGQYTSVTAESGYWKDIQDAVDSVVAQGGIGNVYIPEGTWDFVNVGEGWAGNVPRVTIFAGVNLFGAPTERDANDQVIEWKTILRLPWDVPGGWGSDAPWWFEIQGTGDTNKPSRFSDIKLVGYRSIDPTSVQVQQGMIIDNVIDFRVDHCYFEHTCMGAVQPRNSRGVVDHCFMVNPVGVIGTTMDECTVFYGVNPGRGFGDYWEDDVSKVLGKYTDYTVFIEDCYFEKWRHCTGANHGAHYILRHSTIKDDHGFGSIDAHGWGRWDGTKVTMVGTRAVELYENQLIDSIGGPPAYVTFIRGGSGVAFNNTVGGGGYTYFIHFSNEADPEVSKCWIHDWWVWDNTLLAGCTEIIKYDPEDQIIEGRDYFLHAPHTFNYTPYPYPHPLTIEAKP